MTLLSFPDAGEQEEERSGDGRELVDFHGVWFCCLDGEN